VDDGRELAELENAKAVDGEQPPLAEGHIYTIPPL
jgi:hypothetical protein